MVEDNKIENNSLTDSPVEDNEFKIAPAFRTAEEMEQSLKGLIEGERKRKPFYAESPLILGCEERLAGIFHSEMTILTNTGMGAISGAVSIAVAERRRRQKKDRQQSPLYMILPRPELAYYHSGDPLARELELANIRVIQTNVYDENEVEKAVEKVKKAGGALVGMFMEGLSNSTNMPIASDLSEYEKILGADAFIIVDATLSPWRDFHQEISNKSKLITVASVTKDPSGGQIMAGVIAGSGQLEGYRESLRVRGALITPDKPLEALEHNLDSFRERYQRASQWAQSFAQRLYDFADRHKDLGIEVFYPGLPNYPHHELTKKLGLPPTVMFVDLGSKERADAFVNTITKAAKNEGHQAVIATSFGTPPTRLFLKGEVDPERRGLVRVSVGSAPIGPGQEERMSKFFGRLGRFLARAEDRHLRMLNRFMQKGGEDEKTGKGDH